LNDNGEMMAKCYEMVNWKLLPVWDEAPSAWVASWVDQFSSL
jgi:hypothetical protein